MTGLLLLGVIGIWMVIVILLVIRLGKFFKKAWLRYLVSALAITVLLPVPVMDELITAPQFEKLCVENAKLKFDPERIRGRTVFLADDPQPDLSIGLLKGYYIQGRYLDATTREQLVVASSYHLKGGIFIRTLGISETNAPLTMRSYCAPKEKVWQKSFLDRYNLKYVERESIE
jgi:hypothetical protein